MAKNFTPHRIGFYIAIVVVWQIIAMAGIWPDNIFPSPYEEIGRASCRERV